MLAAIAATSSVRVFSGCRLDMSSFYLTSADSARPEVLEQTAVFTQVVEALPSAEGCRALR